MPGREDHYPWTKWYWQDYLSDENLSDCSLAAQGLWMRMLGYMARSEKRGYLLLNGNQKESKSLAEQKQIESKVLAKRTHTEEQVIEQLLNELEENRVFSRDENGVIFSRRLVREAELSKIRSEAGRKGGRPSLRRRGNQNESNLKAKENQNESKDESKLKAASASASASASEYKNKEEEKGVEKETKKAIQIELPAWIDSNLWHDYLEMRKRIRKPATLRAQELVIKKLDDLRAEGHDPNRVLEQSIENSWQGVFALKSLDASPGYQKPLRASQTGKSPDIGYPPGYWEKVRELKAKGFEGEALTAELKKIPAFAESKK